MLWIIYKKISFLSEQRRLNHVINTESIKHFILFMTSKKLMISLISFLTSYAKFCFLWVKLVSYQKVPSYSTMMLWILSVYNVIFIGRGTQKMYFWNIKKFFNKKLFFVSLRQNREWSWNYFWIWNFVYFNHVWNKVDIFKGQSTKSFQKQIESISDKKLKGTRE